MKSVTNQRTRDDSNLKLTDSWLGRVLTPNRHVRDYYARSEFLTLTIRLNGRKVPQVLIDRMFVTTIKTRGELRDLARLLKIRLTEENAICD